MIARVVRSGVVEAVHDGAVAAVDRGGTLRFSHGDIDRRCFLRSAAKPFQGMVSRRFGPSMPDEMQALACSSHGGQPVHIAIVKAMLAEVNLTVADLRSTPAWPHDQRARDRIIAKGFRHPRPEFHNCSGKHAAMLRACVAQGWPTETYLDPAHPLQEAIRQELERVMDVRLDTPGIDGCGAPVWQGSVRELAVANVRLGSEPEYAPVWRAMHRFAALTSDTHEAPAALARWADVAAKFGAEGMLGVATSGGVGIGLKSWDGSVRALGVVAAAVLADLGVLNPAAADRLDADLGAVTLGGGNPVGRIEATVGG